MMLTQMTTEEKLKAMQWLREQAGKLALSNALYSELHHVADYFERHAEEAEEARAMGVAHYEEFLKVDGAAFKGVGDQIAKIIAESGMPLSVVRGEPLAPLNHVGGTMLDNSKPVKP